MSENQVKKFLKKYNSGTIKTHDFFSSPTYGKTQEFFLI